MFNKRGQEGLSMPTVIIMILGLLVLIVVGVIFTGGTASIQQKIRDFFVGGTGGTDLAVAEAQCNTQCQIAQGLSVNNQPDSGYCNNEYVIKDSQGVPRTETCQSLVPGCNVAC